MRTLLGGENLWDVLGEAVAAAADGERVEFVFNGTTHDVEPHESFESAKARLETRTGWPLLSPDEQAAKASADLAKMQAEADTAIAQANVPTEAQMRDADVPWLKTLDELAAYIKALTERPHDYGTCVYAMSMAATAAFQHVASVLGVTGFQAGCADMDILRRIRHMKHGFQIIDYANALYPQYWDAERAPIFRAVLHGKGGKHLRDSARKLLAEASPSTHPEVKAHWQMIVDTQAVK